MSKDKYQKCKEAILEPDIIPSIKKEEK